MAYEYESRISNSIDRDKNYFFTTTSKDMKDELQKVYRKAKAFDKLVEFYPQKDEIPSDEFFMMMGYIIKEREDDER